MKKPALSKPVIIGLFYSCVILFILILLVMLILWFKPDESPKTLPSNPVNQSQTVSTSQLNTPSNDTDKQTEQQTNTPENNPPSKFVTGLEDLPKSLQGSDVDGEIIIDASFQLVVTRGLRRLFDYFLSAMGEEPKETIYQRVEAYIMQHTPAPANSQAMTIFNSYVQYLQSMNNLKEQFGHLQLQTTQSGEFDASLIEQRKQKIIQMRKQYFDQATIKAFFDAEDDLENYGLAMIDIGTDENLDSQQRQQKKLDYINQLPDSADKKALQKLHQQQQDITELLQRTAELKKQGATATELYHMRAEMVGEEAAKRLAVIDNEESNFEKRFIEYQQKKKEILIKSKKVMDANTLSTEQEKYTKALQEKLEELESSLFSASERKRLAGYEAVYNENNNN